MTTTDTRPRCARCGLPARALIHTGTHPERCHPFTTHAPCGAMLDDPTVAGLPAICDLDAGHAGPHGESQGAGGVEWANVARCHHCGGAPEEHQPDDHQFMSETERRWRLAATGLGIDVSEAPIPLTVKAIWDACGHDRYRMLKLARRVDEMAQRMS